MTVTKRRLRRSDAAVTMIELLCVMVIIAILAGLLLPTVARAYRRVRGWAEVNEAPEVAELLRHATRSYCKANPNFAFASKSDFESKCLLNPKCRVWVEASLTQFVPFGYADPTNEIVLTVFLGPRHDTVYSFTKQELSAWP